jgi:uncharacterized membrane protein
MSWIFYALLAPAIWGAVNHIDKFIISKYFSHAPVTLLVLFTSMTAGIAAIVISFFVPVFAISLSQALWIVIGGIIFVASYVPYVYALQEDEASLVAPLFQMIFVFSLILGYIFLGEKLTTIQIIASLIVIVGAIVLSIDLDSTVRKIRSLSFFRMMLASFLVAVNMLIFKMVALGSSFWVTTFWEYVGAVIFGFILLGISKNSRNAFFTVLKEKRSVIGWNIFNETLNLIARLSANFASLVVPLALVSVANGSQPFFIAIYGLLIPIIFKGTEKEKFYGKYLAQKVVSILLMILGAYFLFK